MTPRFLVARWSSRCDRFGGHAAVSGKFAGLVDIRAGRKMYLQCRGLGSPTVVLVRAVPENGN